MKPKSVIFSALILSLFVLPIFVNAAPISIEQVDVGDITVPLLFNDVDGNTGKVVLNNGDVVFRAKYIGSHYQIYYYNHTAGDTTLISVAPDGVTEGTNDSTNPSVSADGNFVVFESYASNLVAGDTNGLLDVFVRDIALSTTSIVSVDSNEVQGDGESSLPSISGDGNFVVFASGSSNLVAGDTNGQYDIFRRDIVAGTTIRISVDSNELEANDLSYNSDVSSDGNFVAFYSYASNLVAGDTNVQYDIFLRDVALGTTTRVSVSDAEAEANNSSANPSISGDGNLVAFSSTASNLVAGDTNGLSDIFLRDIALGTTTRVSVDSSEGEGNSNSDYPTISPGGNYIVFESYSSNLVAGDTNGTSDIFIRDLTLGTTARVSVSSAEVEGGADSHLPSISPDGNSVAFSSNATNLVSGDTNAISDIFLRDIALGTTVVVSDAQKFTTKSYQGSSTCTCVKSISSENRYVVFESAATNLVSGDTNNQTDVFLRDTEADTTTRISVDSNEVEGDGSSSGPSVSGDGSRVVFVSDATNLVPSDTNGQTDVFLRDTVAGTTTRVSVSSAEDEADFSSGSPSISSDGNFVVFYSYATNLVAGDTNNVPDVFIRDIALGTTTRVSLTDAEAEGNDNSDAPTISDDGNLVVFESYATNLVAGDTNGTVDIFIRNIALGTTTRLSVDSNEVEANSSSSSPSISTDGNFVVFTSNATNLVFGDTNFSQDIFLRDIALGTTTRLSVDSDEVEGNGFSAAPSISLDGKYVAFHSDATNLVAGDTNGQNDIFFRDIALGTTTRVSSSVSDVEGNGSSELGHISPDGSLVAFGSYSTNLIDGVTGTNGGNYFLARVLAVAESTPEPTHHNSSGSSPRKIILAPVYPIVPTVTPTDCLPNYKFSPITGLACPKQTPNKFQFLKNLHLGMINVDILKLQKYLNTHGFPLVHPAVAGQAGAGSVGHETSKFGALTKKALIKFQIANHISPPVGFFGPITRAKVNSSI